MTESESILVIVGRGDDRKPRAGRIATHDRGATMAVAVMQGYRALRPADFVEGTDLEKLPNVGVANDGRLKVPPVKVADYRQLLASLTPEAQGPVLPEPADEGAVPEPWASIAVGQLVLGCRPEEIEYGWFESIVVSVYDDLVTLRFRDYPGEREYTVNRAKIGIILA